MRRLAIRPRHDWQGKVEGQGLIFHSANGPYWKEDACYQFTLDEIERIEAATNALHALCLEAVEHIISRNRFAEIAIPAASVPAIITSWQEDMPSIYGRFDLAYDGDAVKLLEYNADTPTALLEAAVIQWTWKEELYPHADQFNSIHDALVKKWRDLRAHLRSNRVYFTSLDDNEDIITVTYLRETAERAGLTTSYIPISQIGWNESAGEFRDEGDKRMDSIFKLYPWEWIPRDFYGSEILKSIPMVQWIEPPWKMILSNKAILPILWELFEGHPNLLEAHFDPAHLSNPASYIQKPFFSREGANIRRVEKGSVIETEGDYGEEGFIYQAIASNPPHDGAHAVLGSWVIDGEAAGMGIRESSGLITDNMSTFVPHIIL